MHCDMVLEQWSSITLVPSQMADRIYVDDRQRHHRVSRRLFSSGVCVRIWLRDLDVFDDPLLACCAGGVCERVFLS